MDLEDPVEVARIKKEFEMYKLNKENELASMQRRVHKCEEENRRLRAELQVMYK